MAKANSKQPKATIGPAQDPKFGYNEPAFKEPANPADQIRFGSLPIRTSPDMTIRRAFRFPTKPSLHRNEGLSMDEFNQPRHEDSVGENKQPYSLGSNKPLTEEGEPVRGS